VSPTTAEATRASLAALSALIVKPDTKGSDTLEGMVRELLKPMLSEWLDAKLPEIVERHVAQEIARISARG
jgi:cell pole-organizing protein PopZ